MVVVINQNKCRIEAHLFPQAKNNTITIKHTQYNNENNDTHSKKRECWVLSQKTKHNNKT